MYEDRRTAARTPCRLRVLVEGDAALTADVTPNGFCMETPHLLSPGRAVTGTITVGERSFEFSGMVCWARGDDPLHARMGVRFLEVPREFQEELRSLH
jgi:PilZ domain